MSVRYSWSPKGDSIAAKGLHMLLLDRRSALWAAHMLFLMPWPSACLSSVAESQPVREAPMSHLSPVSLQRRGRGPSAVPVEHPEPLALHLYNCKPLSCRRTQQTMRQLLGVAPKQRHYTQRPLTSYKRKHPKPPVPHKAQQPGMLGHEPGVEEPGLGIPQSQST